MSGDDEFGDESATSSVTRLDDGADDDAADQPVRPLSGVDLARAALARARDEARARGTAAPTAGASLGASGRIGLVPARARRPRTARRDAVEAAGRTGLGRTDRDRRCHRAVGRDRRRRTGRTLPAGQVRSGRLAVGGRVDGVGDPGAVAGRAGARPHRRCGRPRGGDADRGAGSDRPGLASRGPSCPRPWASRYLRLRYGDPQATELAQHSHI